MPAVKQRHFVDCKVLFDLNLYAFIISLLGILVLTVLSLVGVFEVGHPFSMNVGFSSGLFTLLGFGAIGGLVAADFSKAFTIFHTIFFPGKTNWYFSWYEDEIIRILPQDFFMNCAILIFVSIVTLCLFAMAQGIVTKDK